MEVMPITLLRNLDVTANDFTIKVRIIKKWEVADRYNAGQTFVIEMVLMDEEENKIQAVVLKKYLYKFQGIFNENACYVIRNPSLGQKDARFAVVPHPHKLLLTNTSSVTECTDFGGSLYGFSFTPFDQLINNGIPSESVIDVIGFVYTYFQLEKTTTQNGKQCNRINLQLQSLENQLIYVTLWDTYADQMWDFLSSQQQGSFIVMILQFGRFKFWNRKAYVSTCYKASRLFINSEVDDITSFKNRWLARDDQQSSSGHRSKGSSMISSVHDDFLSKTEFKHIVELNEVNEVKKVIVCATVKCVLPHEEWYYLGCPLCNFKADFKLLIGEKNDGPSAEIENSHIYECINADCKEKVVTPTPRFRVQLRVQDPTGVLTLILFDRDARKLLGKTAEELLEKKEIDGSLADITAHPTEFSILVEKCFAFKIDIKNFNIRKKKDDAVQSFSISKVTDDAGIIAELKKKYNLEQDFNSTSTDVKSIEFQSDDAMHTKEAESFTDDNVTPISTIQGAGTKSSKFDGEASNSTTKRNLVDVYDVDDNDDKGLKVPKLANQKLLTPKVEK